MPYRSRDPNTPESQGRRLIGTFLMQIYSIMISIQDILTFIYGHLPSTLDPWFSPDGNIQSGVEWLPLSMICSWPLKGSSGQPAIRRPPWLSEWMHRELTKLVHMKSLDLLGLMMLKCLCQFECSYVLTWMEIYVAFRIMSLYWETLPEEVLLFLSGISRTPTIFSLFSEGTTTSTTIQMPLRQNEILFRLFLPL